MGGGAEMCPHIYKVYSCERSDARPKAPLCTARRAERPPLYKDILICLYMAM